MARKRLGELLLERGLITPEQLEQGLAHHRTSRQRLGVALIQKGFIGEEDLARALGEALGMEVVDLRAVQADWSAVHLLRARFCETHDLFPYGVEQVRGRKQVVVAMSDPLNVPAVEEIEFTTGLKVVPKLAPLSQVRAAILRYYHKVNPDDSPEGSMTLIQRGGGARTISMTETPPGLAPARTPTDDEEVIVGEEVAQPEVTARTALADLISQREAQRLERRKKASAQPSAAASRDLDFLFGVREDTDAVEALERKFWALMRLMARKGLITKDELLKELDES